MLPRTTRPSAATASRATRTHPRSRMGARLASRRRRDGPSWSTTARQPGSPCPPQRADAKGSGKRRRRQKRLAYPSAGAVCPRPWGWLATTCRHARPPAQSFRSLSGGSPPNHFHMPASAPKRPPTSTPTTTRRAHRALSQAQGMFGCDERRPGLPPRACGGASSTACVTGLTMVASIASCAPCQRGRPLATTSMQRASLTGTSMFMSASLTLRATRAPLSRQTRATACSSGRALDANVAQASPSGSRRPRQRQVRGAKGSGKRSRRRRSTRRCSGGRATAADVGSTVRARPEWGPACESSSARDAGCSSRAATAARCQPRRWPSPLQARPQRSTRAPERQPHALALRPCMRRQGLVASRHAAHGGKLAAALHQPGSAGAAQENILPRDLVGGRGTGGSKSHAETRGYGAIMFTGVSGGAVRRKHTEEVLGAG